MTSGEKKIFLNCEERSVSRQRSRQQFLDWAAETVRGANLDELDRRLRSLLHAEARITNSALAEKLGIAPSTCHGRVRRLLKLGVIRGFYAYVDPTAVGLPLQLMISVSLQSNARGKIRSFIQQMRRKRQVRDVYF